MKHLYDDIRVLIVTACLIFISPLRAQTSIPAWCHDLPRAEFKNLERVPNPNQWFEIYRIAPGVFSIYEPHQAEETIGYLIVGGRRAVLFDTGMGIGDLKNVTAALTNKPILVLNSHTHNDHVGNNWQFATIYGIDSEFTRRNARGSTSDAQAEIKPDQICGSLPVGFNRATYATHPWKISSYIHDNETIDLGGRSLTILATPGHTPDSISLLDSAAGLLFTGDTFYPGTIWLYRPETDLIAYEASIRRLAALTPHLKMVLGAHNVPVASPTVLPQLVTAFEAVRTHKVAASPTSDGKVTYKVGNISFLMHAPPTVPQ
jgi:glyoxylase-like metal-dependent hydrolase (beta-lactamase superfamily II)